MSAAIRRVRYHETKSYLANPHRGCCTFQHFNGQPLFPGTFWSEEGPVEFSELENTPHSMTDKRTQNFCSRWDGVVQGYLPCTVAYCRWFWKVLEPEEGVYDFSMIEKSFEMCRRKRQTLAVRLMAFGSVHNGVDLPEWYKEKYPVVNVGRKSVKHFYPDHDSAEYLDKWGALISEFASRYDGHPLLESIDVTFIGPWGEGDGKISEEQSQRFVDLFAKAFRKTPRLSLITETQMKPNILTGSGWRCDCFGDVRRAGTPDTLNSACWNHMEEYYPSMVFTCGATEAWKNAPVHFESCWVPMHWHQNDYDLDFIIQQGYKYHGTYFMPKYTAIPEEWIGPLFDFCQRLGYRFIFRFAHLPTQTGLREPFRLQAWIENVGVAPIYRDYKLAVRFRQDDKEVIVKLDDADPRKWLPGDFWLETDIRIPDGFRLGWLKLAVGLVHPETDIASVSFAVEECFGDRWVDLNGIEAV